MQFSYGKHCSKYNNMSITIAFPTLKISQHYIKLFSILSLYEMKWFMSFISEYHLFTRTFFWVIKIRMCKWTIFLATTWRLSLELFKSARNKDFFFCLYQKVSIQFFWPALPSLLVFPKYTGPICIFNQCLNRVRIHLQFVRRSCHPAFRSTCRAILSRGTNSPRRDLPDETRYSQFRSPESRSREVSSSSFLPPIDLPSPHSLLTPREHRSVSTFKLNFFCFFSCLLLRSINLCIK